MTKQALVISTLIDNGYIPSTDEFSITDVMLDSYCNVYKKLFSKTSKKLSKANLSYARKLAGINLLKESISRITTNHRKRKAALSCGIVYIITNDVFKDYVKIGITKDLNKRLNTYQTYCPNRDFYVKHYKFVINAKQEEKVIINKFKLSSSTGEWVLLTEGLLNYFLDQ